jgi:flagellar protein FliO/FliZ
MVPAAGTGGALGNAQTVDETALAFSDQGTGQAQAGAAASGTSTIGYFLRMILVLGLVIGAIYLVFRVMKRIGRPKQRGEELVKVLAQTSLGAGKAVHVIGLGDKAWLIGSSESGVSLIAEIDDKVLLDDLALKAATAPTQPKTDFASVLSGLLGKRRGGAGRKGANDGLGPDYLAQQRERLKKL